MIRARWMAVLLLAVALPGCGAWPLGEPSVSPRPLPDGRLVCMVDRGAGGLTPYYHQHLLTPALAIYGDGRVIRHDGNQAAGVPAAYVLSHADPELVKTFVADAEARDVINSQTDFGTPQVTDMPSTTVQLHGSSGLHRVYVYAFGEGFDDDLNRAQRQARRELAEVIDRAYALSGHDQGSPYRPERVQVTEFRFVDSGKGPGMTWPGPDPESFLVPFSPPTSRLACGELTGSAAERVYEAARKNPGGLWTSDSKPRVFAVAPVLPDTVGCPI